VREREREEECIVKDYSTCEKESALAFRVRFFIKDFDSVIVRVCVHIN